MADAWTVQKLNDSLQREQIKPLYLLYGDETFLIDESLHLLETKALGDGLRDFNFNTFYGGDVDVAQLRDAIETLPMMAARRVIVVKDAHELTDKEWDQLLPLIDEPVGSSVFVAIANKIDKRKKSMKRFLDNGVVVEFKRPFDNQIPDWIRTIARKHSLKLAPGATELLHQLVGSNLQDINSEMLKLSQLLGSEKTVTEDVILKSVSHTRIDSVFDLTDAIGAGDLARALGCLVNLLDHGQNEVGVVALIARHVRILRLINEGLKEGLSGARLSSRAGVSPYFLKNYIDQARGWSEPRLDRTFEALLDTDRALKSSPVASHIWLENFVVQTCR